MSCSSVSRGQFHSYQIPFLNAFDQFSQCKQLIAAANSITLVVYNLEENKVVRLREIPADIHSLTIREDGAVLFVTADKVCKILFGETGVVSIPFTGLRQSPIQFSRNTLRFFDYSNWSDAVLKYYCVTQEALEKGDLHLKQSTVVNRVGCVINDQFYVAFSGSRLDSFSVINRIHILDMFNGRTTIVKPQATEGDVNVLPVSESDEDDYNYGSYQVDNDRLVHKESSIIDNTLFCAINYQNISKHFSDPFILEISLATGQLVHAHIPDEGSSSLLEYAVNDDYIACVLKIGCDTHQLNVIDRKTLGRKSVYTFPKDAKYFALGFTKHNLCVAYHDIERFFEAKRFKFVAISYVDWTHCITDFTTHAPCPKLSFHDDKFIIIDHSKEKRVSVIKIV